MKPLNTTPEEVLRNAIQSEVATYHYYRKLADTVELTPVRKRLRELADLQQVHRAKLERRYREIVGNDPPEPSPVEPETPPAAEKLDLQQVLKIALDHERESESNYRFLAERVPDTELGTLFLELAEMEWQHKTEIQREYDGLLSPEQFLLDIS